MYWELIRLNLCNSVGVFFLLARHCNTSWLFSNSTNVLWLFFFLLNNSWRQHLTKQQLYGHPPPITKTIKIRRTRHVGHCWRSRDELISDVLLWTPSHGRAKAERPARTYVQQLCVDTGCSPEDLPEAMNNRYGWRKRVMDICADGTKRWWWWFQISVCVISFFIYLQIL